MIVLEAKKGNYDETYEWLEKLRRREYLKILNKYGEIGVSALASSTPVDSGVTAASWSYKVEVSNGSFGISWYNSHVHDGVIIALILQLGHGTGTGGYVEGRDYINPALQPLFEQILEELRSEVA